MLRFLFSLIGKRVFKTQFCILRIGVLTEYNKLRIFENQTYLGLLEKLLISGEDHRFRYHPGFDIIAIIRAIKNKVFYNKTEGASTIEQQLVRVITGDYNRTIYRKIKEIFLATTLYEIIPRKHIPILYLYTAYYGSGMNGLNQMIKKHHIRNSDLHSVEMCAGIIARIKYPEPSKQNDIRQVQIEKRKKHLLNLYNKHSSKNIFPIYG